MIMMVIIWLMGFIVGVRVGKNKMLKLMGIK